MSQHWYTPSGDAAHFCGPGGSGTTLREARKLNLVPSVSTVLDLIAKPQLTSWLVKQGILAALTLPRIPGESEESLLKRIDEDGRKQAQEAAEEGTRIHAAIEDAFAHKPVPERYRPHVTAVQRMLSDNYNGVTDWISEKRFAHPAGFGGCVDLHSPSTGIVIDFKGADIRSGQVKKLAYEQNRQLAAYQWGLGLRMNREGPCANLFVSRVEPGFVVCHSWSEDEMNQGLAIFQAALQLWREIKGYKP